MGIKSIFWLILMTSLLSACGVGLPTQSDQIQEPPSAPIQDQVRDPDPTLAPSDERSPWQILERSLAFDSQDPLYEIQVVWPYLEGEVAVTTPFNNEIDRLVTSAITAFQDQMAEEPSAEEGRPISWLTLDYEVTIASDRFISIYLTFETYFAYSAHPFPFSQAVNYDAANGQVIALADLFFPGEYLPMAVLDDIDAALSLRDLGYTAGTVGVVLEERENWNLLPEGLRFNFDVYEVGPYAAGPQYVLLPWEDLASQVDPDGPAGFFSGR